VRKGQLATAQDRQGPQHSAEVRPGSRHEVIVLIHHWEVARTSVSIALGGQPGWWRPPVISTLDRTPHTVLLWWQRRGCAPEKKGPWVEDECAFKIGISSGRETFQAHELS
jgi:hypothetical protein